MATDTDGDAASCTDSSSSPKGYAGSHGKGGSSGTDAGFDDGQDRMASMASVDKHQHLGLVVFKYVGHAESQGVLVKDSCGNQQGAIADKWGFTSPAGGYPAVTDTYVGLQGTSVLTALDGSGLFTLEAGTSGKLPSTIRMVLHSQQQEVASMYLTTSCKLPLRPGDRFGFFEVAAAFTSKGLPGGCANAGEGESDSSATCAWPRPR